MSVNYELRPATPNDAAALQQACWPERSVDGVRELLERAEGLAKHRRGLGIIATNDYSTLGYAQLTIWPRTCEISDLIVAADMRSQGIGTALICDLVERARQWPSARFQGKSYHSIGFGWRARASDLSGDATKIEHRRYNMNIAEEIAKEAYG
jgi:GNAT superfamily N-acetyltransferase